MPAGETWKARYAELKARAPILFERAINIATAVRANIEPFSEARAERVAAETEISIVSLVLAALDGDHGEQ